MALEWRKGRWDGPEEVEESSDDGKSEYPIGVGVLVLGEVFKSLVVPVVEEVLRREDRRSGLYGC